MAEMIGCMWDGQIDTRHLYSALRLTAHKYYKDGTSLSPGAGTGFVVNPVLNQDHKGFLVTNRHVVDPNFVKGGSGQALGSITVQGHHQSTKYPTSAPDPISFTIRRPQPRFLDGHPLLDLAVIDLDTADIDGELLVNAIGAHHLAGFRDYGEEITAGTQVLMSGFPGIGGQVADRPILVSGTIASDPRFSAAIGPNTYADTVLCHAFSWGGMSGSPVFALSPLKANTWDALETGRNSRLRLAGVNAGHIIIGEGELTRFVKSTALIELLYQLGVKILALKRGHGQDDLKPRRPLIVKDVPLTD